jgi:hypothetical protein
LLYNDTLSQKQKQTFSFLMKFFRKLTPILSSIPVVLHYKAWFLFH